MNQKRPRFFFAVLIVASLASSSCGWIDSLKARDEINKGVKAYTEKAYPTAVEHFSRAAELDPGLLVAKLYLAHSYRHQWTPDDPAEGNLANARQAIQAFENVLLDDSKNDNALASIASIYDGLGEADHAKQWYRKRIEAEPENPEPYYGIGRINQRLSEELTGSDGVNVENLSEEELAQAQQYTDEGVKELKLALELDPEYANAVEYLNLIYREKAYLSVDEDEKERWQREASRLSLQVIELRRKQKLRAEQEGHEFFKTDSEDK